METATGAEYISQAHVRHIMRYVDAREMLGTKHMVIADAACGTGYGSHILATYHSVFGFDNCDEAIIEARKHHNKECFFEYRNILQASLPGHYDAIVSIETVEHFDKPMGERLIRNFWNSLRISGTLIISTPYCETSGPSPVTKQHLWEYSLTDFEQMLTYAGFSVENIKIQRNEGKAGRLGYCMAKAVKR
jgi:2-polyprenyl-3-methyl-5-hydroxy-6-metoxy-1,4-benzoquinol methylase